MLIEEIAENVAELVEKLNFAEKVQRSLDLIKRAYQEYGDSLVVANSLGKDSSVIWDLAKRVSPKIRGFIITTRFKPPETKQFMANEVARFPELKVYSNDEEIPDK
ncbi:MAG: phosphoadenosine phosphosulfate reductase family protein, partial [Planctomycetota bacterium]